MNNIQAATETLNDLILINNDRIAGFERAIGELKDTDTELKKTFTNFISESHAFKMEIATEVAALGTDIAEGTSVSGKLHRTWLDVKSTFSGSSDHSILEECEFGEDAMKKAYATAMEDDSIPAYIQQILASQQLSINAAHDLIKKLRDNTVE